MDGFIDERIERYAGEHSDPESELLAELARETGSLPGAIMLSGRLVSATLRMLVRLTHAKHALEVGMYTGYSALSIASELPDGGTLTTCEIDSDNAAIARSYFARSPHGAKIDVRLGPALETIATLDVTFDFAFIDADKQAYPDYYEAILPRMRGGGVIAVDNVLWDGKVADASHQDADTTAIRELNARVAVDPRVHRVLAPIRDGLLIIQKKDQD